MWLAGQRHSNRHALQLPARKLVRIALQQGLGIGKAYLPEQLDSPPRSRHCGKPGVQPEGLIDVLPDFEGGGEGSSGILWHYGQPATSQRRQFAVVPV
jgi:hypothetical protein